MENTTESLIAFLEAHPGIPGTELLDQLRAFERKYPISMDPMTDESSATTSEDGMTTFGPA